MHVHMRGRTWRARTLMTWMAAGILLAAAALGGHTLTVRAVDDPVVRTDRLSYAAGDTVEITATGFLANDTVTVQVTHDDGAAEAGMGHEAFHATTDASGTALATWTIDPRDLASNAFTVTVFGSRGPVHSPVFWRRAIVETDAAAYPAMAQIPIGGRGFAPGEAVTLQVTHADGGLETGGGHDAWTVIAREDGTILSSWYIGIDDQAGDAFVLNATGARTGAATPATFRRGAVVQTDKSDYQPGEIAVITGYGFAPGEEVTLQVTHLTGTNDGNGHTPFSVFSDVHGAISATWYVDPDDSLGSKFLLTAIGATTSRTASTTFWDAGTIPLTAVNTAYTENFDTLATTNAATPPANTVVPLGWDLSESGSSTRNNAGYAAGTGSDNAGDVYSFGAAGSSERAFGTLLSGTLNPVIGAQFRNDTGTTITSLAISYTGEMWRAGVTNRGAADRLNFQYSVTATSLTTGTWIDESALTLLSPNLAATEGALNGNANRAVVVATLTGLAIGPNATFWIRWTDFNISGSDDGLAIDDFSLTPNPVQMPSLSVSDVSSNEGNSGSTEFAFTIRLSSAAPSGGVTFTATTADNTATAPGDYGSRAATMTIPAGQTSVTFPVPVVGDTVVEDNETFVVNLSNVTGATVADGQGQGTIVNDDIANPCTLSHTPIPQIQGSGAAVTTTAAVRTRGIVVGDYEGPAPALRGFFIQDAAGDGNEATSDGIFVFDAQGRNLVSLGQEVVVTGTPGENQEQSQISLGTAGTVTICNTGQAVTPVDVMMPFPSATYLERFEGMLVRFPQTLSVTEHFQLGRFGQVVLSSGGRLRQPTHVAAPGAPAAAIEAANALNRIILDDDVQTQNNDPIRIARGGQPLSAGNTLRGGDTATGLVGLLNYTWAGNAASGNAYRVRALGALNGSAIFEPANPRPAAPPDVGGSVRVVGMNLLNFFNTFDGLPDNVDNCRFGVGGLPADCRGADTATEFARQWPKTIAAIVAMNPDVLAVNELENDGYGGDSAIQFLVDRLNEATAPGTYAFIDADAATGQVNAMGTDAIRSALLYKPATVTPVGQTAVLNSAAFVNGGDSVPRGRPSIAQAFSRTGTGGRFIVDANHFKSKGSACDVPDQNDGQDNCGVVRLNAARALVNWLATDPTGTGDPDVLIVGDLNSYAQEESITAIRSAGFTDLIATVLGPDAYSYVFDGQWGYLDHALASASLVGQVTGVGDYHINADEPSVLDYNTDFKSANLQTVLYAPDQFRVSDHDPVIIGLTPNAAPTVTAGPFSVNEGSSTTLVATGSDPNGDTLSYAWDLDNDGTFETAGNPVTFSAAGLDGPGSRTVQVRVTDTGNLAAATSATVTILNVAPTVGTPSITPRPSTEGAAVSATATFSDPAFALDAPFTCSVDYGDGSGALPGSVAGNTCTGPAHIYGSYGSYTVTVSVTDKDGSLGSNTAIQAVIFNWTGFFQPVDNLPAWNAAKAGSAIPVKFSLGGSKGLAIMAAGYPRVALVSCADATGVSEIEQTLTAGGSTLSYDAASQQYVYVWKTEKGWANSCRELQVQLVDGTTHTARFTFK